APIWVSRIRARRRAGSATMASCRIRSELRALHRSADQPRTWLEPSPVRLALQLDLTRLFVAEARSRRPGGLLAFVDAPGWASPRHSVRGDEMIRNGGFAGVPPARRTPSSARFHEPGQGEGASPGISRLPQVPPNATIVRCRARQSFLHLRSPQLRSRPLRAPRSTTGPRSTSD